MCLKYEQKLCSTDTPCYKAHFLNLYVNHLVYFHIILTYVQVLNLRLMLKSLKQSLDTEDSSFFYVILTQFN